jgi:M6 family metalloprotease-like protein
MSRMNPTSTGTRLALATALFAGALTVPVGAQGQSAVTHDVVHLGERYGTPLPDGVLEMLEADPEAFTFAGRGFGGAVPARSGGPSGGPLGGLARIFGQYDGNVSGTFRFPVLLGSYPNETTPGESVDAVAAQFFDGPNPTGTITEYYEEASGGRVQLIGEPMDWQVSSLSRQEVTGGESGLRPPSRVGEFILELLVANDDGSVDWGRYDNDGPDGVPNSGDDDGRVDVLAVIHPTHGAECGGPGNATRIWSHRWNLLSAAGQEYVTGSPSANGGFIRVLDYTIQPVRNCGNDDINDIGVFAHELGHGFGLPDLYATGGAGHAGIGTWGLMGSGSWGCDNGGAARPCLPGAWTREQLGWGTFQDLPPETDLGTLTFRSPVEGGTIYRYRVPDADTYYLLEYRGRTGFDSRVRSAGLLVWQIDEGIIAMRRPSNRVNADPGAMGVWVRQADGRNDLGDTGDDGNRSDGGDPFPGLTGATAFHASTLPSARILGGAASRLTLTDITEGADEVTAAVTTATARLTLQTVGGSSPDLFTVNGLPTGPGVVGRFAPYEVVEVIAGGGISVAEGVRQGFSGWTDGSDDRTRVLEIDTNDVTLTADYATTEFKVDAELTGPVPAVVPGVIGATPSLPGFWFPGGTEVQFAAGPYPGFRYEGWGGDLVGEPNPVTVRVDAPIAFEAIFSQDYGVATDAVTALVAGSDVAAVLEVRGSLGAVFWEILSGALPEGTALEADGRITGTPLQTGRFDARVRVRDSRGLTAEADLAFDVSAPDIAVPVLAGPMLGTVTVPTAGQQAWLDRAGNRDGAYDLGDALLYLRRGGGDAAAARVEGLLRTLTIPAALPPDGAATTSGSDGGGR